MVDHVNSAVSEELALVRRDGGRSGITVLAGKSNPRLWRVAIGNFDDGTKNGASFQHDLESHMRATAGKAGCGDARVHVEVLFPEAFPEHPPLVMIRSPLLVRFTGGVAGGAICLPPIFNEGWNPKHFSMDMILGWVKASLVREGARVQIGVATPYPDLAFHACRARYMARKSVAPLSVGPVAQDRFNKAFYIASAKFVQECTLSDDVGVPPGFELGDKVLIPASVMRVLEDSMSGAAMTFEIKSHHGVRTYCGIGGTHRLPAPDGEDVLVLPNWLMRAAAASEMTQVTVRPVALPRLEHVQVLPFTKDFGALPDPKRFLEYAMTKYSCIALGAVVELQEDGKDLSFYVTGLKPRAPAASAWQGDWESTISLDVLPAQDDVKAVAAAQASRERDRGAITRAQWGSGQSQAAGDGGDQSNASAYGGPTASGAGSAHAPQQGTPPSTADEDQETQRANLFEDTQANADRKLAEDAADGILQQRARRAQVARRMQQEGLRIGDAPPAPNDLRFRVVLMRTPLSEVDQPETVTLHASSRLTLGQLYEFVRVRLCPANVPFSLTTRGGSRLPNEDAIMAVDAGVHRQTIEQELTRGRKCDAKLRRRTVAAAAAAAAPATSRLSGGRASRPAATDYADDEVPPGSLPQYRQAKRIRKMLQRRVGAPSHYVCECTTINLWSKSRCTACSKQRPDVTMAKAMLESQADHLEREVARAVHRQRASLHRSGRGASDAATEQSISEGGSSDSSNDLSTFVVADGVVTLSSEFACPWLEELQRSKSLSRSDLAVLTKEVVLANREAVLLQDHHVFVLR